MGFKKCPKCELNYIRDDQKLCEVCARKHKISDDDDEQEELICIECGEHPAMKGKELCAHCYKESLRQEQMLQQHQQSASSDMDDDGLDGGMSGEELDGGIDVYDADGYDAGAGPDDEDDFDEEADEE